MTLVCLQQTVDAVGQAAGNAIQGPIHGAIRDVILPGFDRACQGIFRQVNDSLQRGLGDCEYIKLAFRLKDVLRPVSFFGPRGETVIYLPLVIVVAA